jgi:hypothetical protein
MGSGFVGLGCLLLLRVGSMDVDDGWWLMGESKSRDDAKMRLWLVLCAMLCYSLFYLVERWCRVSPFVLGVVWG